MPILKLVPRSFPPADVQALADITRYETMQQVERGEPERLIQALDAVIYGAGFGDEMRQEVLDLIIQDSCGRGSFTGQVVH